MLAIIGGSRLAQLPILQITHRQVVRTPYGDPSCALTFGRIGTQNVVFMARHGYGNSIAPHEINARANIWALHSVGVKRILAIGSVGGIRPDMQPGMLVVPDDMIDYTWGRAHTYYEGPDRPPVRVDFTRPYDEPLRQQIVAAASASGIAYHEGGVYAVTQGPRLETAAEVRRLQREGCDVVGMTGMPEAVLARELGVAYANVCLVANWAAGKGDCQQHIVFAEDALASGIAKVQQLLATLCGQP
ncbi:S-methyl-5'-thioinosine phosphorylase [Vogesella sp. LIG4]|uniref:S-methyl-5'-thioinosine phosphorylase n=1 Tax=Vogesella sp. LIG4 TaxID=1192162 RepID=UPI0008201A60|nr:S-methyl-5'-thioinosine phosphorylase [Vogesella sp. LIG4]SCK16314.1 5'-methylthioadenosine phosphorylase [Vogesella sp. LIG4]